MIELLIVTSLVATLLAVSIPVYLKHQSGAKHSLLPDSSRGGVSQHYFALGGDGGKGNDNGIGRGGG